MNSCGTLELGKQIGSGSFGVVFKAKYKGKDVVAKKIGGSNINQDVLYDIVFGKLFKSPHIVNYEGFCRIMLKDYIILEEMESDMDHWIKFNFIEDKIPMVMPFLQQMTSALSVLYNNYCIHNDIKPSNILVRGNIFKLADFGLTQSILQLERSKFFGNTTTLAPESLVINIEKVDLDISKMDVWALGMTVYKMITNDYYFKNIKTREIIEEMRTKVDKEITIERLIEAIKNQDNDFELVLPENVTVHSSLIQKMLKIRVADRISIPELCRYFAQSKPSCEPLRRFQNYKFQEYIPRHHVVAMAKIANSLRDQFMVLYILDQMRKKNIPEKYEYLAYYISQVFWGQTIPYDSNIYVLLELLDYHIYEPSLELLIRNFTELNLSQVTLISIPYTLYTDLTIENMIKYGKSADKIILSADQLSLIKNTVDDLDDLFYVITMANRLFLKGHAVTKDLVALAQKSIYTSYDNLFKELNYSITYISPILFAFVFGIRITDEIENKLIDNITNVTNKTLYDIFIHAVQDKQSIIKYV